MQPKEGACCQVASVLISVNTVGQNIELLTKLQNVFVLISPSIHTLKKGLPLLSQLYSQSLNRKTQPLTCGRDLSKLSIRASNKHVTRYAISMNGLHQLRLRYEVYDVASPLLTTLFFMQLMWISLKYKEQTGIIKAYID